MLLGLLAMALIATLSFFAYQDNSNKRDSKAIGGAIQDALRGDWDSSRAKAEVFLSANGPDSPYYLDAQLAIISELLWSTDQSQNMEGVSKIKQLYMQLEDKPTKQAKLVNLLLSYIYNAGGTVFAEAARGEPFNKYFIAGDRLGSLKNLAEHSLSLYRTSAALLQIGKSSAIKLIQNHDGVVRLSEKDISAYQQTILNALTEADALYTEEDTASRGNATYPLFLSSFFYDRGYLYGVLALNDPQYLDAAEYSFNRVINQQTGLVNIEGAVPLLLDTRLVYSHLELALLFQNIEGNKHTKEDVARHLQEIASIVSTRPENHQKFFIPFLREMASSTLKGFWFSAPRIRGVASLDTSFHQLLVEYGWKF